MFSFLPSGFDPPSLPTLFALLSAYYLLLWGYRKYWYLPKGTRLPPGPKGLPFIGNVHQLPRTYPWLQFTTWAREYGPVVYFHAFGSGAVVLNSAKAVADLLEARSAIYSDRSIPKMATLAGRDRSVFACSSQSPRFRPYRRMLNSGLNPRATKGYEPIQTHELHVFLKGLLSSPDRFHAHIRRNAVGIILKVAYGYETHEVDDTLVELIEDMFRLAGQLGAPGKFWVEFMPILMHVPEWLPGAGFKKLAREAGKRVSDIENVPLDWAKKRILEGGYVESFTSNQLVSDKGTLKTDAEVEDIVKWTAGALYIGGGETTVSIVTSFFLLMALHPDVQKRAQADIDRVASGRLPKVGDYPSLPYLRAIIQEVSRWGPVAPLGIPHAVVQDDIYEDMFIPKGTRILANIWAITHDESIYPDPFKFDPERHLGLNPQPDPFKFVFGFGRRICPGAHFAEMTMFLNMAGILSVFNITKVKENGKEVDPPIEWTTGVTSHLKPFKVDITPRSAETHALIERLG